MELIQYPQEKCGAGIAKAILALEDTAWPQGPEEQSFPSAPNTYVTSFILMEKGRAICHVGIRKSALHHRGEAYLAYGLSEVVTHPAYQAKGLATKTVQRAAEFLAAQGADLSIFTCAKENVGLYARCGWEQMPGACLVGGTKSKPFRSDSLNLATMMRLLSSKAKRHRADFEQGDIVLELGENQLW